MDFIDKIVEFIGDGLTFDLSHIIIQISATIILFIIVRKFMWGPITNLIEARRNLINQELNEAKMKNAEAERLEILTKEEYLKTKEESKNIIEKAINEANLEKEKLILEAKQEAKRRLEEADFNINQEIINKSDEIKKEIVDIAFDAALKIVGREINKEDHKDIIDEIIEELVI